MTVEPLQAARDHLSEVVDRVGSSTSGSRNGRALAVLISRQDLAELEETLSVRRCMRWPTSARLTRLTPVAMSRGVCRRSAGSAGD